MLARFVLSIAALAATAAVAAPPVEPRAQSYVFHYGIGRPVCSIWIPWRDNYG